MRTATSDETDPLGTQHSAPSTSSPALSTSTPAPISRRRGWMIVGGAVLAAAVISAGVWFFLGAKTWTDGGAIRVSDRDANVREVLWDVPRPLQGFSSDEQVYEPSLSPDGTELYFVRGKAGGGAHVFVSYRRHNAWTTPQPVDAVNGPFDSLGPRVSPDGNYLFFYSDRPGGLGGYDIWAAPRTGDGWGKPLNLGPKINSEFNEFNPDPTPNGRKLIFATNRKAARREQHEAWRSTIRETVSSDYDLWIADVDRIAAPATLPTTQPATQPARSAGPGYALAFGPAREIPGINTPFSEGASCMSPAGDFLYFASNRPGGGGKFDVWRCRVHGGQFGPVENVGPPVNTAENEADPALAFNGFRMVFSSDRPGADGRYYLLASDSREVYPERVGRPLPHLGWSAWLLIASILILVPLLMFLRGWEDHRLSILQRALLLSLLVHALITFALSFVVVTQNVTHYVRKEMGLEVPVNLKDAPAMEESLAIRSQVSGDLPTSAAAPATLAPSKVPDELAPAPTPMELKVPGARIAPNSMSVATEAPRSVNVAAESQAPKADVASAARADSIDVKLPSAQAVSAPEAQPTLTAVRNGLGRVAEKAITDSPPAQVGAAGAGPGRVQIADAAPVNANVRAIDLQVAPAGRTLRALGNHGTELGAGPSPYAQTAQAIAGPQISLAGAAAARARQAASEPQPVAPIASGLGATTRSVAVASDAPAAGVNVELAGGGKVMPVERTGAALAMPDSSRKTEIVDALSGGNPAASSAVADQIAGPDLGGAVGDPHAAPKLAAGEGRATASDVATADRLHAPSDATAWAPKTLDVGPAPVRAKPDVKAGGGDVRLAGPTLASARVESASVAPLIGLAPIEGPLGPGKLAMPDSPFLRAPEERKPLLKKFGGTPKSEEAVDLGLAYLARMQEPDGRWTRVEDDRPRGRRTSSQLIERPRDRHDMACTGFAVLAFLARDHTPDRPGPYRDTVAKAIDYLVSMQDEDGDLRGLRQFRGGGSDSANMYDQGIATYALAECGIMTHDPKVIDAALKGAQFIVRAQDRNSGGWRYSPGEYGDSSVFGWQIMALHSAEQSGFEIPRDTLDGAKRYLQSCREGEHGLLAGYQPHRGATPTMTAELIFCRMLLDMPLSDDGMHEATRFLAHQPPEANNADFYYWYYASLSMLHMNNPLWKDWNVLTREALIRLQKKDGPSAGCWVGDSRWAQRGGRVFSTAMATLTLEVYYRYLPLRKPTPDGARDAVNVDDAGPKP